MRKWYRVVTLWILITKIDLEKIEETKKNLLDKILAYTLILKKDWYLITPCIEIWGIILSAKSSNDLININIVTSQLTARKTQIVKLIQTCTELWSTSKIRCKNAYYIMVFIHHWTNHVCIGKKSILEWKRQNKILNAYMNSSRKLIL